MKDEQDPLTSVRYLRRKRDAESGVDIPSDGAASMASTPLLPAFPVSSREQSLQLDEAKEHSYKFVQPPIFKRSATSSTWSEKYDPFSPKLRNLRRQFSLNKQLLRLLWSGLWRWIITLVLVIALYVVLIDFSRKDVMSERQKKVFNALITGLSVALGLNIQRSLKALAIDMRWWILSRKARPLREVDLILQCESLTHVFQLAVIAPRPKVLLAVGSWLLLNIASQVGIATLGLIYSTNDANYLALLRPGFVTIPDLSTIITSKVVSSASQVQLALQYTANTFGTLSLSLGEGSSPDDVPAPGTLWSDGNLIIFSGSDYSTYVFLEYNSIPDNSSANPIYVTTNRAITASGICDSWPVIAGGDGRSRNITISLDGEEVNKTLPIAGGTAQTTFGTIPEANCGFGCSTIHAFEASVDAPWYYRCNITVGNVTNAIIPQHKVGADLLNLASCAIALQGYGASTLFNYTNVQFQSYPAETTFGQPFNGSKTDMAYLMSRFAIGVIGITAYNNPTFNVPGMEPQNGVVLQISGWKYVHIILGLTAGIPLILFIATAVIVNRVMVKDDSHLAIARLLRPMVDTMGDSGTSATSKDICNVIGLQEMFIYSVRNGEDKDVWQLDIGQEERVERFPEGMYD